MIGRRAILAGWTGAFSRSGAAVALRLSDGRAVRIENEAAARGQAAAPGSVLKPWLLDALAPWKARPCSGRFRLRGWTLDCIHAPAAGALDAETAVAASCNQWFAAAALAAGPERVRQRLLEAGAEARQARTPEELQLQALGLEGVRITAWALAQAYRRLALHGGGTVLQGLRRAVTEGTAQAAAVEGLEVAGKTGTSREGAWFAGFAPASRPALVVAVFQPAGRGGSDAAPIAAEWFAWAMRSGLL